MFAERVVAELERRLTKGAVQPGERLPSEQELAIELSVSLPGVRKAIHLLKAMGVVEAE